MPARDQLPPEALRPPPIVSTHWLGFIHASGPRVAEPGLGLISGRAFSAPYEDPKLKR